MTTQTIPLLKAIGEKMAYLDQRQKLIANNIANADTPKYKPMDLKAVDFGQMLKAEQGKASVRPQTTHSAHMPSPGSVPRPDAEEKDNAYEVAPAGNSVVLEEQLINSRKTVTDYNLMLNLYRKNISMYRTALGQGGQ